MKNICTEPGAANKAALIKALSLINPWGYLVVLLEKRFETRSWAPKYRGPIAVHASYNFPKEAKQLCQMEPFKSTLQKHGIMLPGQLCRGAIIGTCKLTKIYRITQSELVEIHCKPGMEPEILPLPTGNELEFGDYTPGRFAWRLEDQKLLAKPIPAKGALNLWEWNVPAGVVLE